MRRVVLIVLLAALAAFYWRAATEHGRRVNTARARADQSGYLWDAVGIHMTRHGSPDALIGERNRMPVYPWLLSWIYDPSMTPDGFFEAGKRFNIGLSLGLLAVFGVTTKRFLPTLPWANLLLIVAFGYFVFKAGYAQVELLYYSLFFLTFLACCLLLRAERPRGMVALAVLSGGLAALAQLSKAGALLLVIVMAGVLAGRALAALVRGGARTAAVRAAAAAVFVATFLAVMAPYLLNSKRVFGHYFYNVNTTFYVWYDDWSSASQGVYRMGDGVGWPNLPPEQTPSLKKYLREHSARQIAARFANGFVEIFTVSYDRMGFFLYVVLYVLFAAALVASNRRAFAALIRSRPALFAFLVLYAVTYTAAVSFYQPISGTTLRMLLVHVAPLLFILSCFFTRPPFSDTTLRGTRIGQHFHLLVAIVIGLDLSFRFWPRLMANFAGY